MTDLENYSDRLWKNAYERGKSDTIKAVLEIIKRMRIDNYEEYDSAV